MLFKLTPLACPELGVIEVSDALFSVGRGRGDFKRLSAANSERLSERHARLFGQNGGLFVVDLGSEFGTFVNGQPVSGKPVALNQGDEVNFGGSLPFRIDLAEPDPEPAQDDGADTTLSLEPVDPQSGPEPLRISAFPFVVSKKSEVFAKYRDRVGAELDFISRRHAQVSLQDGRILLQDLGSTNGTRVDGRLIGDQAVVLENGQTVAFGGDYFVYRVSIQVPVEARLPVAEPPVQRPTPPRAESTTFVTAGSSFLDILCADDSKHEADTKAQTDPDGKQTERAATEKKRLIPLPDQLVRLLQGLDRAALRRLQVIAASVVAVLFVIGFLLTRDSPTERIESLLAEGRIDDALQIARDKVGALGGDTSFDRLALRALIMKTLPPWLDAYDDSDFASMQTVVEAGRDASPEQTATLDYIDTLSLIGDVKQVVDARGGAGAPLRLFDPESAEVRAVVDVWNRPRPDKRKVTQSLLGAVPAEDAVLVRRYRDAYQKAVSDVRALESRLAVYEPAIKQVESTIARSLASGALDDLSEDLDRFAERYSQFSGFDALQRDLERYLELVEATSGERVIDAVELAATSAFYAAPFAAAAERLVRDELPAEAFLDSYASALEAWQAGEVESALAQLQPLLTSDSSDIAQREIIRIEAIVSDVNALQTLERSAEYDERVLTLYHSLDGDRDRYIVSLLRAEYDDSRAAVEVRAHQAAAAAARAWGEYKARGGITSTQRLQSGIDEDYRQSAAVLERAASAKREARRLFDLAKVPTPPEHEAPLSAVEKEVALQYQALDELVGVLQESGLREKRSLLPERL